MDSPFAHVFARSEPSADGLHASSASLAAAAPCWRQEVLSCRSLIIPCLVFPLGMFSASAGPACSQPVNSPSFVYSPRCIKAWLLCLPNHLRDGVLGKTTTHRFTCKGETPVNVRVLDACKQSHEARAQNSRNNPTLDLYPPTPQVLTFLVILGRDRVVRSRD